MIGHMSFVQKVQISGLLHQFHNFKAGNMEKILQLIIFATTLLFFACDDEDDKKELRPYKLNKNGQECFNVVCYEVNGDTICYQNPGTPKAEILTKSSVCYSVLKVEDPPSTPTNIPPVEKAPAYQFNIEFLDSINKKFGFDPAKGSFDISNSLNERRINYFSIKEDGEFQIKVSISTASRNMFSSFYIKILNTAISFDSLTLLDSLALFNTTINDTVDTISIYGRWATFVEIPLIIAGINRSGTEKNLVCNDTCDEAIIAKCYNEKVIDSLRIYRINNPSFNPTDSVLQEQFNYVLKQAVVSVKGVSKQTFDSTTWDNNHNNILDLFSNTDSVPDTMLEHILLLSKIENEYSDCKSCWNELEQNQEPKIFVLPSTIQRNWIILEEAVAGSDTIVLQSSHEYYDMFRKETLFISTWIDTQSEEIVLNNIVNDYGNGKVCLKLYNGYKPTLLKSYPKHSVLVEKGKVKGFTHKTKSCAFIEDTNSFRNIIHEYLHTAKVGPLSHALTDTCNLMYGGINYQNKMLRYRHINTSNDYGEGSNIRQWDILNRY